MDHGVMSLNLKHDGNTADGKKYQVIMYASYSDALRFDGSTVSSNIKL